MSWHPARPNIHDESRFRATLAALFITATGTSVYHRRKADQLGGTVPLRDEGIGMLLALRLGGLALWGSVIAYLLNPRWMQWSQVRVPAWLRWLGAACGAITVVLLQWMFRSLGTNITPTVATRTQHTLITAGPYRWVRHPLYALGTVFFVSLSVLAANWFIGGASLVALLLLRRRLPQEEARLIAQFGDEYRTYMHHTGRLVPRLRR